MSFPRKIRNIYLSQVKSLKERLDRIDAESQDLQFTSISSEAMARDELYNSPLAIPPEEKISQSALAAPAPIPVQLNSLAVYYRLLGVPENSDMTAVNAAYRRLASRCNPIRFPEGSEERQVVTEIRNRLDEAHRLIREARDPSPGRFDKLEL